MGGLDKVYQHKPQGTGQGNGTAPQLWAVVNTKMFNILHKLGLATRFSTAITGTDMHIVGFTYVDDSDLISLSESHDIPYIVQKMQEIVKTWETAARVTGGAIEP